MKKYKLTAPDDFSIEVPESDIIYVEGGFIDLGLFDFMKHAGIRIEAAGAQAQGVNYANRP